jgi:hypothetical protein
LYPTDSRGRWLPRAKKKEKNPFGGKEAKKKEGPHRSTRGKTEFYVQTRNYFAPLRSVTMGCSEL